MALESIIPKMLITDKTVAIATGELTKTFSDAGPFPPMDTMSPNNIKIPKYAQVAGRFSLYLISNKNISVNIGEKFCKIILNN